MRIRTLDRFWNKVIKTDYCWLFKNGIKRNDYGTFGFRGKVRKAHIVSYILHFGEIPNGMCVCHTCDNPPCIRPDHLFLGTNSDNIKDAYKKGRVVIPPIESLPRGTQRKNAKINDQKALEIINKYSTGLYSFRDLSKQYGICTRTIGNIIHKRKWKHVN